MQYLQLQYLLLLAYNRDTVLTELLAYKEPSLTDTLSIRLFLLTTEIQHLWLFLLTTVNTVSTALLSYKDIYIQSDALFTALLAYNRNTVLMTSFLQQR